MKAHHSKTHQTASCLKKCAGNPYPIGRTTDAFKEVDERTAPRGSMYSPAGAPLMRLRKEKSKRQIVVRQIRGHVWRWIRWGLLWWIPTRGENR